MKSSVLLSFLVIGCCLSCERKGGNPGVSEGDTLQTVYAKGFDLIQGDRYLCAVVYNPWQEGEVYARYYLVKDTSVVIPGDGIKIRVPLRTLAANSATYYESLHLIGSLPTVTGTCNASYVYNPQIRQGVAKGEIVDLGDSYNLNIEKLMKLHPEAVMTTAYNSKDENSKRLAACGIPVLYNVEWQEVTPLGRAEWIRFIAAFYDKLPEADSIFSGIAQRYEELKEKVSTSTLKEKPSLLVGQDYRGTWSMPAGESFNANLYRDAGASYYYSDEKGTGSVNTTIERALLNFGTADFWIAAVADTYGEMAGMNSKYTLFESYKGHKVYNFNKRTAPSGGNDYWEGAVVHADLLLSDLVKVLHPELLPGYETTYMKALNP